MRTVICVIPEINQACVDQRLQLAYRAYLLVKACDEAGTGYLGRNEVLAGLRTIKSRRQAREILKQALEAGFCTVHWSRRENRALIRIASDRALLARFGIAQSSGTVLLDVATIIGPNYRRGLYAAHMTLRNRRPTARATRTAMTGLTKSSQIRAEKQLGIIAERNYIESTDASFDAPNVFVRAADGVLVEEIASSAIVPAAVARRTRRRTSAPVHGTGVYQKRRQRRYQPDQARARREGRESMLWADRQPDIAGGNSLLVPTDPGDGVRTENGQRVRYWEPVRRG